MKFLRWLFYACALPVCLLVSLAHAGDWQQKDLTTSLDDPLRLSRAQWLRFSLQAGKYRAAVERDGSSGVARTMTFIPTVLLTTPQRQFQPYIGAGMGLSVAEMTPGEENVPLQLEESFIMHIGGGFAYRFAPGVAFTSSARYVQFKGSDLFGRFASSQLPLSDEGLDFNNFSVQFGFRVTY